MTPAADPLRSVPADPPSVTGPAGAAGRPAGVTLLGCGVVGGGVLEILHARREAIWQMTGLRFDVRHVVARDLTKARDVAGRFGLNGRVGDDAEAAIDDPAVRIVVELIGGTSRAGELVSRALAAGKAVVTANKSLLASRGGELFTLARRHDTCVAFEASCGGGIPIIDALTKGLLANRVESLVGIVNGTCNVILTRMSQDGLSYADALAEAQRAGFAEADPTLDVGGHDAAQKLAILARLAFGVSIDASAIHVEGVDGVSPIDLAYAKQAGYAVKLLATGHREADGRLSLAVRPALVSRRDVLAEVGGPFNAVGVYGHAVGHTLFYGRGAGRGPTASAVVADLIAVASGAWPATFRRLSVFDDDVPHADVAPFGQTVGRYYLRLTVRDEPGVLADVTAILGREKIGVSGVTQKEHGEEHGEEYGVSDASDTLGKDLLAAVVILTHAAREDAVQAARRSIDALPATAAPTVVLRIVDPPAEFAQSVDE